MRLPADDLTTVLDAIQERADAATPGPWGRDTATFPWGAVTENVVGPGGLWDVATCHGGDLPPDEGRAQQARRDADFLARARTDIPRLLAAVRAVLNVIEWTDRPLISTAQVRDALTSALTGEVESRGDRA